MGDGFSGDELKPGFGFRVLKRRKRRKSGSIPRIGPLETESAPNKERQVVSQTFEPYQGRKFTNRRAPRKDVWPTMEDFIDGTIVNTTNRTILNSQMTIPETRVCGQPPTYRQGDHGENPILESRYNRPQIRAPVEFENFRRDLRPNANCHPTSETTIFQHREPGTSCTDISQTEESYEYEDIIETRQDFEKMFEEYIEGLCEEHENESEESERFEEEYDGNYSEESYTISCDPSLMAEKVTMKALVAVQEAARLM